jgi:hypothetical protein
MAWPKGRPRPPNSGRKAGTPNKYPEEVRLAVMAAFDMLGGVKYLENVGRTNPPVFCMLLGKILPHELATSGGSLRHEVLLRWMTPEMAKARGFVLPATEEETGSG